MRPQCRPASVSTSEPAFKPGWLRRLLMGLVMLCPAAILAGCGHLFFYPSKQQFMTPDQIGLQYEDVWLTTPDHETLHGWLLKPQGPLRGSVYFLHGNAENISTHIGSVMWLPAHGYQVFLLDYRGFGKSTGSPNIDTALADAEVGYRWLSGRTETQIRPLFLLGQSLGGALSITLSARMPDLHQKVTGVIVDSSFAGFRDIAREKLDLFWLTWAVQHPLSWLIPKEHDPIDHVAAISPTPLLILHSTEDEVVPQHHGIRLFEAAHPPKMFLSTTTRHNATFTTRENRHQVLHFMRLLTIPSTPLPGHHLQRTLAP